MQVIRNLIVLALGTVSGMAAAQQQIIFRFDRPVPGVLVPRYHFELHEDGSASYHAEVVTAGVSEPQPIDKSLSFAQPTVRRAFEAAAAQRESDTPCASKLKNIADTGTKTIIYKNKESETVCTFNYTENKGAAQLTDLFQGMELTLEAGRALVFKRRFDRLGLDAEMATLTKQVEDGRAQGLEAIAPTLRSIASDTELIERVRVQAGKLLELIEKAQ